MEKIKDAFAILGFFLALLVFMFSLIKGYYEKKASRKKLLYDVYLKIFYDKDALKMFNKISRNKIDYKIDDNKYLEFIPISDEEDIDKILIVFETVSVLFYKNELTHSEISLIKHDLLMIYENEKIKGYIGWLKEVYKGKEKGNYYGNYERLCENIKCGCSYI